MIKIRLIVILIGLVASQTFAQTQFSTSESSVTFQIKNMGINVDGKLKGFKVNAKFNPNKPEKSTFKVSLESNTIDTKNKSRDKHLRNRDYFNVIEYPYITFKSTNVTKTTQGYEVEGKLTIKNTTKIVKIPFNINRTDLKTTLSGTFKVNRLDYDVGEPSWVLGNQVTIMVKCTLN